MPAPSFLSSEMPSLSLGPSSFEQQYGLDASWYWSRASAYSYGYTREETYLDNLKVIMDACEGIAVRARHERACRESTP